MPAREMNWINRQCRKLVLRHLAQMRGQLALEERGETSLHGRKTGGEAKSLDSDSVVAHLRVMDPAFYGRVVFSGDLGFAESVRRGECESDDMTALLRFFIRNANQTTRLDRGVARVRRFVAKCAHWFRRNTRQNAQRNILAHYDLSNEFFALFLDETWCYSSAIFESSCDSLASASHRKIHRACRRAELQPQDHLLEIGTGWGQLAQTAAEDYGCRVTTTTISKQQFEFAQQRFREARLTDQIRLVDRDYRDLEGQFDKIISIEMIEAVGHQYFDAFFKSCAALLRPDGLFCLQAIVIADHKYETYIRDIDFIRAYIFPGGCLPSVSAMTTAAANHGLQLVELEEYGTHYAETLRRWRTRFRENRDNIKKLGFDTEFLRLWEYYFTYCEAGFREKQIGLVQAIFSHRNRPEVRFDHDERHTANSALLADSVS